MNLGEAVELYFGGGEVRAATASQIAEALTPGAIWKVYCTAAAAIVCYLEDGTTLSVSLAVNGEFRLRCTSVRVTSGTILVYGRIGVNIVVGVNPTTISGLVGWYKADAGVVLVDGSPTSVIQWQDQSSAAVHLDGEGPTFDADGVARGRPAIFATGILTSPTGAATQPVTVLVVLKPRNMSGQDETVFVGLGPAGNGPEITTDGSDLIANAGTDLAFGTGLTGDWQVFTMLFNGGSSTAQVEDQTAGAGAAGANNQIGVGIFSDPSGGAMIVDPQVGIAEVLIYDASVSAPNIALLKTYLRQRWGLE